MALGNVWLLQERKWGNCIKHAVGIKNLVLGHHVLVVDIIRAVDRLPIFKPYKVGPIRKPLEWTCTLPLRDCVLGWFSDEILGLLDGCNWNLVAGSKQTDQALVARRTDCIIYWLGLKSYFKSSLGFGPMSS